MYNIVLLTTKHILYKQQEIPDNHQEKGDSSREVRSFLPRSRSSEPWRAEVIEDEVRLHGNEDGRQDDEVPPHAEKGANSFSTIQAHVHFVLLQADSPRVQLFHYVRNFRFSTTKKYHFLISCRPRFKVCLPISRYHRKTSNADRSKFHAK
ncbi:MAG: hypothetical protein J6K31_02810 [Parabacteroides sp.]|nr:hypothetical protein [Parabacteroides sp.]